MDILDIDALKYQFKDRLPKHIAIIMDGNGRWARKHALKIIKGHTQGVETLREVVRFVSDVKIPVLSLYAFSNENWKRSNDEISGLMDLILIFFASEVDELHKNNVHIRILGNLNKFPQPQQNAILNAKTLTAANTGLILNIALNYGGQQEILEAVKSLGKKIALGILDYNDIDKKIFEQHLYTQDLPEVDLLIRTSGEKRLSNFLLYQSAYAEFFFPKVLWPDFTIEILADILLEYTKRQRRFGGRASH